MVRSVILAYHPIVIKYVTKLIGTYIHDTSGQIYAYKRESANGIQFNLILNSNTNYVNS